MNIVAVQQITTSRRHTFNSIAIPISLMALPLVFLAIVFSKPIFFSGASFIIFGPAIAGIKTNLVGLPGYEDSESFYFETKYSLIINWILIIVGVIAPFVYGLEK